MNKIVLSGLLAIVSAFGFATPASANSCPAGMRANDCIRFTQATDPGYDLHNRRSGGSYQIAFGGSGYAGVMQQQNPKVKKGDTRIMPDGTMLAYRGKGEWYVVYRPATQPRGVAVQNTVGNNTYIAQ